MKILPEQLEFSDLSELSGFVERFRLAGTVKLLEPVTDNSGSVLIKENVVIKESSLEKLEQLKGLYRPVFKIAIDADLCQRMRSFLISFAMDLLKHKDNQFLAHLFASTEHRYPAYLRTALLPRPVLLTFYKLFLEYHPAFVSCALFGMLCLGIIIQKNIRLRFIHCNAFLAGFVARMPLAGQGAAYADKNASLALAAASMADQLRLAPDLGTALRNNPFDLEKAPPVAAFSLVAESPDFTAEENASDLLVGAPEENKETQSDPRAVSLLTEILRLGHYIYDLTQKIERNAEFAEQLVYMVAYNTEKGYFHKDLALTILHRFREYEALARKIMLIAEIESRCVHPPSAWAYPKPRATQILCQNRVHHCPMLVAGWDINVISPQEAFGWIGKSLEAGSYPKCQLESDLQKLEPA